MEAMYYHSQNNTFFTVLELGVQVHEFTQFLGICSFLMHLQLGYKEWCLLQPPVLFEAYKQSHTRALQNKAEKERNTISEFLHIHFRLA